MSKPALLKQPTTEIPGKPAVTAEAMNEPLKILIVDGPTR